MDETEDRLGGVAGGLSRAIVALRHVVVLGWIAAAVAAVVYLPALGGSGELDLPLPDDAAPLVAEARSAELFGAPLSSRTQLVVAPEAEAARFAVVLDVEPTESPAIERLDAVADALSGMLASAGAPDARAALSGDTAIASASIDAMTTELLRVGIAALLVNLVLLALFLRALVAPLYLLVANALSVAATLGIATWFFQDFLGQGQLVYYVPFATAVLLLALGSDYNIFLVGGIWRAAQDRGIVEGIRTAMPQASLTITVAGVVLAGSFGLLALVPVDALQQFAFVMALGVALDAFVVRPFLVPALIALFGRSGFWPRAPRAVRAPPPVTEAPPA